MQVSWQKGQQLQELWSLVVQLLAYPHTWVRKATARLLGLLLATPKLGKHQSALLQSSTRAAAVKLTCVARCLSYSIRRVRQDSIAEACVVYQPMTCLAQG